MSTKKPRGQKTEGRGRKATKSPASRLPSPASVNRHQDWPTRLFSFIEERRDAPFEWGRQDCCLFVCDGIHAMTGVDPAKPDFRGRYKDGLGAARLLKKHGGVEAVAGMVCARLGFAPVPVASAQRGDVVLIHATANEEPALGLCLGAQGAFPGKAGLEMHPLGDCQQAWAVARPVKIQGGPA